MVDIQWEPIPTKICCVGTKPNGRDIYYNTQALNICSLAVGTSTMTFLPTKYARLIVRNIYENRSILKYLLEALNKFSYVILM